MGREGSLRRRLPAGVIDSGFASLAGFAVALTAVSLFGDADRGVYAIFFTAFVAGALLVNELIFTPAEVEAVAHPVPERLSLLGQSLRLGIGPAVVGSLAAPIAVLVTAGYASGDVTLGLAVTSAAAIVVSPMQDHSRRMLHIAEVSWGAAAVSTVQLVSVAAALGLGIAVDVPVPWLPFGALAFANVVSLTFAALLARTKIDQRTDTVMGFRQLTTTGVWFVVNAAPAALWFVISTIVAALAGPEALGFAESARVIAQPIMVFAGGLAAVLAPRAMRAAMDSDLGQARRERKMYLIAMALFGAGYAAIAGWDWVGNPMAYLVPSAYTVAGLAAFTILANLVTTASFLQGDELAGAGRVRILAGISWFSGVLGLLASLTASVTEAFARPLAGLVAAATRYAAQTRALASAYVVTPAHDSEPADRE
ncbi:MAG: hypothetical protein QNJ89_05970 [Acidimicrobiia bacterium]|nr:hypothetical protein [Acidimicrobiia bacterium]